MSSLTMFCADVKFLRRYKQNEGTNILDRRVCRDLSEHVSSFWNSQRELKCANFVGRSLANFIIMRECTDMPLFQIWTAEQYMLHTFENRTDKTTLNFDH